jgi:hypothetical protein
MDQALIGGAGVVLLSALLATIGYLIKGRLEDIATDIHEMNDKLDNLPSKLYALDARVVRLETWRDYIERRDDSAT